MRKIRMQASTCTRQRSSTPLIILSRKIHYLRTHRWSGIQQQILLLDRARPTTVTIASNRWKQAGARLGDGQMHDTTGLPHDRPNPAVA